MKIAVFYPRSLSASWNCTEGVVRGFRRCGHTVYAVPVNVGADVVLPQYEHLQSLDLVVLSAGEHLASVIENAYGIERWERLGVPRVLWLAETAFREDTNIVSWERIGRLADEYFFPACQDAEFFDQPHFAANRSHYLPFGVDTEMFKAGSEPKVYGAAFIGALYDKRKEFLKQLALKMSDDMALECGNVTVSDLGGMKFEEQTKLYAQNIRQVRVFVNLPALSRLLVTKVTEVMACGTFLVTPQLKGAEKKNCALFSAGRHLAYYEPESHQYLAALMRKWLHPENDKEREKIAAEGMREVHAKHRIEQRCEEILSVLAARAVPQVQEQKEWDLELKAEGVWEECHA